MMSCISCVVLCISMICLPPISGATHDDTDKEIKLSQHGIDDIELANTRQEKIINNVNVFFWMPPSKPHGNGAKGTFLLLHGCGQHARGFYDLPEETQMTLAVLRRGFAVIAPDAYPAMTTRVSECWNLGHDGPLVRDALAQFRQTYQLEGKPVYGLGVSNGGVMLSYLFSTLGVDFDGMHLNVSPGGAVGTTNGGMFATKTYPPVSFVHFVADPVTPSATIQGAVACLRRAHTPVQVLIASPQPLGSLVSRAKKMHMSPALVKKILKALHDWGFAQFRSGPGAAFKASTWRRQRRMQRRQPHFYKMYLPIGTAGHAVKRLFEDPVLGKLVFPHLRVLTEELKVLEGLHSATSQHIGRSLNFLLQHRNRHKKVKRKRARKVPKARRHLRTNLLVN
eukprot:gnl/MRDRNA2_/MRDRNA2_108552_c0_seq1.p1 gnl/MRDRNA2_/MRDRNA2_108552_c0~~gnl/MRDRNA2_/MRDRNA2_108552_c0_seq1.p1  ORF type:complete len:395 (-),score=49.15 gnl/MRDRNA2_/MRDRNA2_108552_c0_seq1:51-1235(-)